MKFVQCEKKPIHPHTAYWITKDFIGLKADEDGLRAKIKFEIALISVLLTDKHYPSLGERLLHLTYTYFIRQPCCSNISPREYHLTCCGRYHCSVIYVENISTREMCRQSWVQKQQQTTTSQTPLKHYRLH